MSLSFVFSNNLFKATYRDIVVSLSVNERRKWEGDYIQAILKKLAHMGYGEIQGGSKGGLRFKKLKDWE